MINHPTTTLCLVYHFQVRKGRGSIVGFFFSFAQNISSSLAAMRTLCHHPRLYFLGKWGLASSFARDGVNGIIVVHFWTLTFPLHHMQLSPLALAILISLQMWHTLQSPCEMWPDKVTQQKLTEIFPIAYLGTMVVLPHNHLCMKARIFHTSCRLAHSEPLQSMF